MRIGRFPFPYAVLTFLISGSGFSQRFAFFLFELIQREAQVNMARGVPHGPFALVFLLSSILYPWGSAQELPGSGVNGFSLHPPYFNLAEGTKITATATCGEDEGRRWTEDLYCKLVGGPVSGDPSQTIQVTHSEAVNST